MAYNEARTWKSRWENIWPCGAKNPGIDQFPKLSTTQIIIHFQHHILTPSSSIIAQISHRISQLKLAYLAHIHNLHKHFLSHSFATEFIHFSLYFISALFLFSFCASLSFFQHMLDRQHHQHSKFLNPYTLSPLFPSQQTTQSPSFINSNRTSKFNLIPDRTKKG